MPGTLGGKGMVLTLTGGVTAAGAGVAGATVAGAVVVGAAAGEATVP
jgi:hypothetical protein